MFHASAKKRLSVKWLALVVLLIVGMAMQAVTSAAALAGVANAPLPTHSVASTAAVDSQTATDRLLADLVWSVCSFAGTQKQGAKASNSCVFCASITASPPADVAALGIIFLDLAGPADAGSDAQTFPSSRRFVSDGPSRAPPVIA